MQTLSSSGVCSWCGIWQPLPTSSIPQCAADSTGELGNQPTVAQAVAVAAFSDPDTNKATSAITGELGNQPTVATSRVAVAAVKSDPDKNISVLAQTRSRETLSAEAEAIKAKWSREVPECLRSYLAQAVTMHRMRKYSFKRTQVVVVSEPMQACISVQTKMKRYIFKRQPFLSA